METVRAFALSIVDGPSLLAKLRAPPDLFDAIDAIDAIGAIDAIENGAAGGSNDAPLRRLRPARDPSIALVDKGSKLPGLGALKDAQARAACLSRFAHHELCAVELFAWALLAFPTMPQALQRGFVHTLAEEQLHCRLYLARLEALGVPFGAFALSDYFWKHTPAMSGPVAFLCAMGLTLEQANLDFTLMYRDAFRAAGDEESARVLQRVHDDEIGHVKLANTWVKKLTGSSDVDAYGAHAPFPFSLARAKGRRFDAGARARAGLSPALVEAVRVARPYSLPTLRQRHG